MPHTMDPTHDDETAALLADAAADFLANEHARDRLRTIDDHHPAINLPTWQQFAQQGWLALRWPDALGGAGLGVHAASALAEQLGRHLVPEPLVACAIVPAVLAEHLASDPGHAAWRAIAEACQSGETLNAVAWQDQPQTLAALPQARVERRPAGLVLHARKWGVVGGALASGFLVSALLDEAPALWWVPRTAAGVSERSFTTSDGGSVSTVNFDGVPLTEADLLGRGPGVTAALEAAIDEALLLTTAQLIGIAEAAQDLTLDYLRTRVQFGHRIGSFQALQHAAVDVRLQAMLARASRHNALRLHARAPSAPQTRAAIAAAKARAGEAAQLAGRFGVQAHGAIGFAAESDIGLYLKAALRLAAYLGNPGQQRERHGQLCGLHEPQP